MIAYENLAEANAPFQAEILDAIAGVVEGGWFILGNEVEAFEAEFAAYHGLPHCVGVASGLDAITLSLQAAELPAGSEVIVPSNTYIATILSVLQAGLKPVLVEPDLATYNIDPARIEAALTDRTRAVLVVHLYGKLCDMDPILQICSSRNLLLFEDCAQSHGARYKGRMSGTFGHAAAYSFYPTKNLGAMGDAGAVVTQVENIAEAVRSLRNYGSKKKYHNDRIGVNSRLDEMQAAILRVKLRRLGEITGHKRRLAALYQAELTDAVVKPVVHADFEDVYHIYNIRHPQRDRLRQFLSDRGIKTDIHYPVPPHKQRAMAGILHGSYPVSEEIHATTLSLPISFATREEEVHQVARAVNEFAS